MVRASAQPLNCLTLFYELSGARTSGGDENNKRRKRQQPSTGAIYLYITLDGQEDVNDFTFNSSIRDVIFGEFTNFSFANDFMYNVTLNFP